MRYFITLSIFFISALSAWEPIAIYTLLEGNPEKEMGVQWITTEDHKKTSLIFCEQGATQWYKIKGTKISMPGPFNLYVHRVVLTDLKPDTVYEFRVRKSSVTHKLRTMPKGLSRPISFVAGGDIYHDTIDYVRAMNRVAAARNPDFALLGGDIAYTNHRISLFPEKVIIWTQQILAALHLGSNKQARWTEWLRAWSEDMISSDGIKIPLFATIGNHDVDGGFNETKESAKAFYALFVGNHPHVYRTIDFGRDLSIIALDSGHTAQIGGVQAMWLFDTLRERRDVPRKFAFYHTPAYPSCRRCNYKQGVLIRRHWVPLFDAFQLNAAFEHHDHAYKRTLPLLKGKEDPKGVLYFGDGAWGVKSPRNPKRDRWYLARSAQSRNVIYVVVKKDEVSYSAYDSEGVVIDRIERS